MVMRIDERPAPFEPDDEPNTDREQLLDRYLADECTPAEAAAVRQSFKGADPLSAVRVALQAAEREQTWDSRRAWQSVHRAMRTPQRLPQRRPQWQTIALRVAASILVLLGTGVVAKQVIRRAPSAASAIAMLETSTGAAERREMMLGDGTHVTLAPRSTL